MRILIVEDDKKTAGFIKKAFQAESFAADVSHCGNEALTLASQINFDVIVLDIMLPGCDGLTLLVQLRLRDNQVPVLLLSARGDVDDRVKGLNAGADDYLSKPFALSELIARVRCLGRRRDDTKPTLLRMGDLCLDTSSRQAIRADRTIELTTREYRLLEFLMRSSGRICGRTEILEKVWRYNFDPGTNVVDVYIKRLRGKVDNGFTVKLLQTVRGVGYVMKLS